MIKYIYYTIRIKQFIRYANGYRENFANPNVSLAVADICDWAGWPHELGNKVFHETIRRQNKCVWYKSITSTEEYNEKL